MASDVTGDVLRGLGVPYDLTPDHLWTDKATFTEQGPTVGQATPQGDYTLALQTAGTQSASKQLRIQAHRGGHPGVKGGAEFIYQYEGDTYWRGADIQQTSSHQVIRTTIETTTQTLKDPDAASFYSTDRSDRICVVYQRLTATGSALVEAATYDPSAGTWSTATVYTNDTIPTDGYHATVAYNRVDGYLYCCHWVYDNAADLAQIATHRSRDGATWETVSEYALDEGVDISSSASAYEVARLRMAFNAGQCLLVARVISNNSSGTSFRDFIGQWASTSRAARFDSIGIQEIEFDGTDEVPFSNHSIIEVDGSFVVAFPGQNGSLPASNSYLYFEPLPSAYSPIAARIENVTTASGALEFKAAGSPILTLTITYAPGQYVVTDGDGSAWVGEDGAVYFAARIVGLYAAADNAVFLLRSDDGGATWEYMGDWDATLASLQAAGALVVNTGDAATYLKDFVGVSHRGRQVLIGLSESDVTTSTTLSATFLGGATTVTLPGRIAYPAPYQRSRWTESYLPFELPANISSMTTAGAGTDTISLDGVLQRTTSSNTLTSYFGNTSTIAQGIIVRMGITVVTGGDLAADNIIMSLRTADGSDDYKVIVRFTRTALRMYDDNASAQIGIDQSVTAFEGIDVLGAIAGDKFSLWVRDLDSKSDRSWTPLIQNHTLTSGGGSAAVSAIALFGTSASSSNGYKIHEFHCMTGTNANGGLGGGQSNPADLRGRTFSRRGRYIGVDDGVRLSAIDGTAMADQTWNIDSAADHPISRIFHRESPSPRSQWRSVAVTSGNVPQQVIPFVLNKNATTLGAEEQGFGSTLAYLSLSGINWSAGSVKRWDVGSSAWVTVATIANSISTTYSYTRRGSELHAPSLPTTSSGRFLYENECAGWSVRFSTGIVRRITGNTAGTLASNVSGPKPTFFLDGIDGSEPTTSTITLIPDTVSMTLQTDGETGGGWAVFIDAQTTAPYTVAGVSQSDARIGHLSMGRVFVFSTQYGRGRIVMYESGDLTEDTPGGTRRTVRAGPGGRSVRIAWTDPVDTTQTQGLTANPDYLTSTTTAGNAAVAAAADLPFSLLGLLRRVGARDPVTYFPAIARSTGSDDVQMFVRRAEHITGTITSAGQFESVLGDEGSAEAVRFSTVVIEELR